MLRSCKSRTGTAMAPKQRLLGRSAARSMSLPRGSGARDETSRSTSSRRRLYRFTAIDGLHADPCGQDGVVPEEDYYNYHRPRGTHDAGTTDATVRADPNHAFHVALGAETIIITRAPHIFPWPQTVRRAINSSM
jgi:hypothetical protein